MIYTSYFAMGKRIPIGIKRISIASYRPKGWEGVEYHDLIPNYDLTRSFRSGKSGDERCEEEYRSYVLRALDPVRVAKDLSALANGRDCVLMTLEGNGRYSCRGTIGKWLREGGIPCEEWEDPEFEARRKKQEVVAQKKLELAEAASAQLSLF